MSDKPKIEWTDAIRSGVRKSETGRELDGETYDEFPNVAQASTPASSGGVSLPVGGTRT